jgi:hypothetical protein
MKHLRNALIATGLALTACSSTRLATEPVSYSLSEAADSVRIRVGETIIVEGLRVRFAAVESDSRCPIDVTCVWAGDAVAKLIADQNCDNCDSPSVELTLHTTLEPKSASAYGFRVELLQLTPYPNSKTTIKSDGYSAWLRVVRVEG